MPDYPKLLWSPYDEEIVVNSKDEEAVLLTEGYRLTRAPQGESAPEPEPFEPKKKAKK